LALGAASSRTGLDPNGDVHRLHGVDRRHAGVGAPGQEFLGSAGIGAPRVRVADVGGKEFEEAERGALAGGGNKRGHSRTDKGGNRMAHERITLFQSMSYSAASSSRASVCLHPPPAS
jgi:hypothetical protein